MKEFIKVPFAEKEKVKELGARWDKDMKSWYVPEDADKEKFSKWERHDPSTAPQIDPNLTRIYLNVPFADKDAVKSLGARWDGDKKQWYFLSDKDKSLFAKWVDGSSSTSTTKKAPIQQNGDLSDELDDILKLGD